MDELTSTIDTYRLRLEKKYGCEFDTQTAAKVIDWKKVYRYVKKHGWSQYLRDCDDETMMMLALDADVDYDYCVKTFYRTLSEKRFYAYVLKEIDSCYNEQSTKELITLVITHGDDDMFRMLLNQQDPDEYIYILLNFAMQRERLDLMKEVFERLKVLDDERLLKLCPECLHDIKRYRSHLARIGFTNAAKCLKYSNYCTGESYHCLDTVNLGYDRQENIINTHKKMFSDACIKGLLPSVRLFLDYIHVDMDIYTETGSDLHHRVYEKYERCKEACDKEVYATILSIIVTQLKPRNLIDKSDLTKYESIIGIIGG